MNRALPETWPTFLDRSRQLSMETVTLVAGNPEAAMQRDWTCIGVWLGLLGDPQSLTLIPHHPDRQPLESWNQTAATKPLQHMLLEYSFNCLIWSFILLNKNNNNYNTIYCGMIESCWAASKWTLTHYICFHIKQTPLASQTCCAAMECIQLLANCFANCITAADKINMLLNEMDHVGCLSHGFVNQMCHY